VSQLTELIAKAKAKDPQLGADMEREFRALSSRLSFGLNFERHRPEAVELPHRPVRRGDKDREAKKRAFLQCEEALVSYRALLNEWDCAACLAERNPLQKIHAPLCGFDPADHVERSL
jgi:hypothetical protein